MIDNYGEFCWASALCPIDLKAKRLPFCFQRIQLGAEII